MADSKITVQVDVQGNAKKKINDLSKGVDDFGKKSKKGFLNAGRIFDNFIANIGSSIAIGAFTKITQGAKKLFNVFVTQGIAAAKKQEDAINALNTALASSGQLSEETSQELQAFASELQSVTKFGDEAILEMQALIQSLGQLDKEGLKGATTATLDLAAALRIDLNSAALLVGKAAAGEVASFSRFGLVVKKGSDNAETFANALDAINSKFGGAAAAQVNTFSGATEQLGNTFGDLQESFGFIITENQSIINVFQELGNILRDLGKEVDGNKDSISDFISDGIIRLIQAFSTMISAVQTVIVVYKKMEKAVLGAKLAMQSVGVVLGTVDKTIVKTVPGLQALEKIFGTTTPAEADKTIRAIASIDEEIKNIETGETGLDKLQDAMFRLRDAAEEGKGKQKEFADGIKNGTIAASLEAADKLKKYSEKVTKLATTIVASIDPFAKLNEQQEKLNEGLRKGALSADLFRQAQEVLNQQRQEVQAKLDEADVQKEQKRISAIEKEADDLRSKNDLLRDIDADGNEEEVRANEDRIRELLSQERGLTDKLIDFDKRVADRRKKEDADRLSAAKQTLGDLASLQNSKVKEIAAVGKAAAVAQTTIDTFRAAQAAVAALAGIPIIGPALGAAAAATIIAAGLARVASIEGTGLGLQGGLTQVPSGFPNDSFGARLSSGERVVSQPQNQDLSAFLRDNEMLGEKVDVLIELIAAQRLQTVVNIGNETILDSIQDGIDSGRALEV